MISFIISRNHVLDIGIKKEPYRYRVLDTRFYLISCIEQIQSNKGVPKCHTTTEKGKKKQNESMISSRILILLLFSNLYCDIIKKLHIIIRKSD